MPYRIIDIEYLVDPAPRFAAIRDMPEPVWLDSGKPWSLSGRFDIMSAAPEFLVETIEGKTRYSDAHRSHTSEEDPFQLARNALKLLGHSTIEELPFVGGLMGYFGYDIARYIERLPSNLPSAVKIPDMRLGGYLWALIQNHAINKAQLVFHPRCPQGLQRDVQLRLKVPTQPRDGYFSLQGRFQPSMDEAGYRRAIEKISDYIQAGDCYQVNFAQHWRSAYTGDPWHAYRHLRRVMHSPFSAFLGWEDKAVLSLSPERFLKLAHNRVETKPIKGTARRGEDLETDQLNAVNLMHSAKDRAENLMIVDLLRNDLGKTCVPGSIRVPKLFALESFANVHHLVSTVTGLLEQQEDALSLLRGCFPGGSITGAPKKRAMEVIEELEQCRRSVYCGSVGYISCNDRMDTAIAIRTLVADGTHLHCWGGGGIVADSNADNEYQESLDKIGKMLHELEGLGN